MGWFLLGLGVGGAVAFAVARLWRVETPPQALPDALPVAACEVADDGRVTWATDAARELFGADLVGRNFESVLPDWEALESHRSEHWTSPMGADLGPVWRLDAVLPDLSLLPVRVQRARRENGWWVCLRDMRNVRQTLERLTGANARLEERLTEAVRQSRAKTTYLTGVAQVLRTPLTAILGYGELLREELDDRGLVELSPDVDRITAAAGALNTILETVLDWTEIQAGRMSVKSRVFDVGEVVREVIEAVRPDLERNENELIVDVPEGFLVLADDRRTAQILKTLLGNAASHTRGGKVLAAVQRGRGKVVQVVIGDTGEGLAPGELEELFVDFGQRTTRADAGRAGLSLLLAHTFAKMMGGTLAVSSDRRDGSDFTLSLPMHDDTEFTPLMLLDDDDDD